MKKANAEHGQTCKPLRASSEGHTCRVTKLAKERAIHFALRLAIAPFRSRRSIIDLIRGTLAILACFYSASLFAQVDVNVVVIGINKKLEDNVRLSLSIEQQKSHVLMSEGRLRRLHKKAPLEISNALQPFGYYQAVVKPELTQSNPNQWTATYTVDPGPPLTVDEFNFIVSSEVGNDAEFQPLIKKPPFNKGDAFNHIEYEEFKARLAKLASERGYFNAHFIKHRIEIDLNKYTARIYLNYDGGVRYRFGEVLLKQNVLDTKLLKRYIPFEKGMPYTLNQMIDLQQALNDSDYFQSVEVSHEQPQINSHEIPVTVKLSPRKPHRFSLGLGYGSDTGARAKFGWQMPRLNTSGHRLDTETRVSQLGYSLGAYYRVPVFNPRTDQMIYSAGVVNETTDSSESTIRSVGASLKHSRGDWREAISLNYQQEDFIVADISDDSTLLLPSINWSRTWGGNFIYAVDGLRFDITLRGANKKLISDTNFTQLQGGIKAISSLNPRNRIIARGRLGSTWTQEFEQLPSSVRFFAGGAQSVRGYAYQSLGPVDVNGKVVGGKLLMVGSLEYEHSLNGQWGIALFYDGGNAIDNINDKLERGAGFGLRWKSPVGPVRIDFASAVTKEGSPWRIHINIGPDL